MINNCQALDKGTRALGLSKDLQEGVLFLCAFPPPFPPFDLIQNCERQQEVLVRLMVHSGLLCALQDQCDAERRFAGTFDRFPD